MPNGAIFGFIVLYQWLEEWESEMADLLFAIGVRHIVEQPLSSKIFSFPPMADSYLHVNERFFLLNPGFSLLFVGHKHVSES